jgi:hypothetical protein
VDALIVRDNEAARAIIAAYNTHSLSLIERLASG